MLLYGLLCLLWTQSNGLVALLKQGTRTIGASQLWSTPQSKKLYQDLQAAKNRRAEYEETLLLPGLELQEETFKVPTASGSGFGAVTSVKSKGMQLAKTLREKGVIRLNNCLVKSTARALRLLVLEEMSRSRSLIEKGMLDAFSVLGMEPERLSRTDFKLSMVRGEQQASHPVADALYELFGEEKSILRSLYDELTGDKGLLFDLGCMTTIQGSPRQPIHTDFPYSKDPPIYSVYVALQDVTASMGPTVFFPRTNNVKDHSEWKKGGVSFDEYLRTKVPKFALLKKGDLIVYDPLVLHCGAANLVETGSVRSLFNVGFRNPKVVGDFGYQGSMRPGYKGKMTFGMLKQCLKNYRVTGATVDPFAKYGNGL